MQHVTTQDPLLSSPWAPALLDWIDGDLERLPWGEHGGVLAGLTLKQKVPGCQKSALGRSWVARERSSVRLSGLPQCLQVPHRSSGATILYKGLGAPVVHAVPANMPSAGLTSLQVQLAGEVPRMQLPNPQHTALLMGHGMNA